MNRNFIERNEQQRVIRDYLGLLVEEHAASVGLHTRPRVKKVIFNSPATIVFWYDGTKTVVKCMEGDIFSQEVGLAMCICKKFLGDDFHRTFKEWVDYEPE